MYSTIFIIGSAGIPSKYGGFETFAENISKLLISNYRISVACSSKLYKKDEYKSAWNCIDRFFIPLSPHGISGIIYDAVSILKAYRNADHVILLGCGAGFLLMFLPRSFRKKIIVHIDGLEWKRKKWNVLVKAYLHYNTKIAMHYAGKIIVDSNSLEAYIPNRYKSKILSISYGGDHLPDVKRKKVHLNQFALVIGRAEPENNLHVLISAFTEIQELDLIIISNWESTRYGRKLIRKYAHNQNIILLNAEYNKVKLQHYRIQCKYYIHGHSCGGTNPSLVEAMYSGLNIISYDNEFNRTTTNNLAKYFKTKEQLVEKIRALETGQAADNSIKIRAYALEHYTWNKVVSEINLNL
ncbi:MAG: DUF1972 domain-containing protein [Bacteroidales bacterium]|nr:DUF1972 domain-containing protein [Bacteroidales bacterium]